MGGYAELVAASNFSFLRGASHPHEMVETAAALRLEAVAITDRNSLAGVVRAHLAAKDAGVRLLVGARLVTLEGLEIVCLPKNKPAYARLSRLLSDANFRMDAEAGERQAPLSISDALNAGADQVLVLLPPGDSSVIVAEASDDARAFGRDDEADWLRHACGFVENAESPVHLALIRHFDARDGERLHRLDALASELGVDTVAATDALFHTPERRELADILACIREHVRIQEAGFLLEANAERHLKPEAEMRRLFAGREDAVLRAAALARSVTFTLDELVYDYPAEVLTPGETPMQTLTRLTWEGAAARYPAGVPETTKTSLEHELELIGTLGYAPYFLTVYDLVRFARSKGILCQGRGSAANSAVCFCIGVTEVDPAKIDLLFERFVSAERGEPPDIDVDFEHERREEVIQYVYEKYGRRRAGMTAVVSSYRPRGAIREVGKVFGLSADVIAALSKAIWGWKGDLCEETLREELGLDPDSPALSRTLLHARELLGFPRHLSQHPGGFVMTAGRLDEIVPVRKAAMPERTAIEWDKDDIDALGLMKVDVLGVGMLTCVQKALDFITRDYGRPLDVSGVPAEDPRVYDMICKADTVGVFQIESRAQMSMLPRLKPRCFYDLVIEVAIVRPGPIQGDMVHPYLRRREGLEPVEFPSEALRAVLGKTLGVPLFQEQAMKIAIVAAGFTPSEADKLRRSMAAFRRAGTIREMGEKLVAGMIANGYERDFAERCFKQLEGFGEYGFPESHAASFALIVYVSCWLKRHYPDAFLAGILNAQPLGFYAPAQLVRDAREHGIIVREPDVNFSDWDCTLEPLAPDEGPAPTPEGGGRKAVRLGLRQIKGLPEATAAKLVAAREADGPFSCFEDLQHRAALSRAEADRLSGADAVRSLTLDRREAGWRALAVAGPDLPLFEAAGEGRPLAASSGALPVMAEAEHVAEDYATLSLSLKAHPVSFLRASLDDLGYRPTEALKTARKGVRMGIAGLVLVRQRPGSAKGVMFATLEDETGVANVIIWPKVFNRFRRTVISARLLGVVGRLQREGAVIHLVAERLVDLTPRLNALTDGDFSENGLARADEVKRNSADPRLEPKLRPGRAVAAIPKPRDFR